MLARVFVLLLILIFPLKGFCGEFGSWWQVTPEGNTIGGEKWNNEYITGIICKKRNNKHLKYRHTVSNLKKWYFYKHCIIGEYLENSKQQFFIFNESNCEAFVFENQHEFNRQITERKLQPKLWTRWYEKSWGSIVTNGDIKAGMIFIYIKLPLIILTLILILVNLIRTRFNLKKISNKICLIILGVLIIRIILDILPGSI